MHELTGQRQNGVTVSIPFPSTNGNGFLDEALAYSHRGLSIIAVSGKRPLTPWKRFQGRQADDSELQEMFSDPKCSGLAVICGEVSGGLTIRDFDRQDAYHAWRDRHSKLAAELPTARTARGYHVYGRTDHRRITTYEDGELRGAGYCLLPSSIHPSGHKYEWLIPLTALPDVDVADLSLGEEAQQAQANPSIPIACVAKFQFGLKLLPTGPGQRNRKVFELARHLKATHPTATAAELKVIVQEWHRLALPVIRTKQFGETWSDFVIAWGRVARPSGATFQAACELAKQTPIPAESIAYDDPLLHELGTLCYCLQKLYGDKPFFLGCREAGAYLGVHFKTAWRLLEVLRFDGVIRRMTKGKRQEKRSSEWRFVRTEESRQ